jgi:hypothetical protein
MTQRLIDYSSSEGEGKTREATTGKTLRSATGKRKKDQDKKARQEAAGGRAAQNRERKGRGGIRQMEAQRRRVFEEAAHRAVRQYDSGPRFRIENRREEPIDYFMKIIFIYKSELKMDDYITVDLLKAPKEDRRPT